MILIFGIRSMRKQLAVVLAMCQRCSHPCAHPIVQLRRWFTFFFIPVIPVGTKYFTVCSMCATATPIQKAEAENLQAQAARQAGQPVRTTPDGPLTPYASGPTAPVQASFQGGQVPPMPPPPPPIYPTQ